MRRFLALILCFLLISSGCEAAPKRYTAAYADVFDTVADFTVFGGTQEDFDKVSEAVHSELLRLHRIFDIYNEYDGLVNAKTVNDNAAGGPVVPPAELYELLESAVLWNERSGGALNIALGPVLSLWHDCREAEEPYLPDPDLLSECGQHCDISELILSGGSVSFADPEMSLDLGALAKGYAAEKAAELAESLGCEHFALSVGGNVVTRGEKPTGMWEIGIASPDGGILTTVRVAGECVVTSGDYQRFFEVDGVRYHHIIDPKTLYPASLWRSVTVICADSADADALSTALFCMDFESGSALAEKFGAEALWVGPDGETKRTEGFSDYEV